MRRTLNALSWVLILLVASERVLSLAERAERRSSSRLRQLVPASLLHDKTIAAVRIEDTARGEVTLFARTPNGWRSLSHWGAPADETRFQNAVGRLLETYGIIRAERAERKQAYGLDPPQLVRVSFHGPRVLEAPDRDVVALVEIGAAVPGGRGTYARVGGNPEVIAGDEDLRDGLATPNGQTLPPLIDARIVPGAWSAGANVERVEVRPERGAAFELRKRPRNLSQQEMLARLTPWEWRLMMGGAEGTTAAGAADAFVAFLQQAPHRVPIDPRPWRALGLDPPRARVVLHPAEGAALELQIGSTIPGGVVVRNALSQAAFVVDPQIAALLMPSPESLKRSEQPNAWETVLRPNVLTTAEQLTR